MNKKKKKSYTLPIILLCLLIAALAAGIVIVGGPIARRARYKLDYTDEIAKYAEEFGVAPSFVTAVIYTESGFKPGATSHAGARGIMQVMPETGAWIAEKLSVSDFNADMLYEPEVSIRFGCWYLAYLIKQFDGELMTAAAAYNAGPGAVSGWLADQSYTEDGRTLTDIPYPETKGYVERVAAARAAYLELYPGVFDE